MTYNVLMGTLNPTHSLLCCGKWGHGLVVNVLDFQLVNLGLIPSGTNVSHWWHQERRPAKMSMGIRTVSRPNLRKRE